MGSQLQCCTNKSHIKMVSKSLASVFILVIAATSVQSRSLISGLLRSIVQEVKAEVKAAKAGPIAHPFGAKTETVYKNKNKADDDCDDCDDCDDANDCGDSGCCPYPVDDCDADTLFICCDSCTGNICGASEWACEQDAKNSLACQNRNRMRFLKTIVIEN